MVDLYLCLCPVTHYTAHCLYILSNVQDHDVSFHFGSVDHLGAAIYMYHKLLVLDVPECSILCIL